MGGGGSARTHGVMPPHISAEMEEQMRSHLQGGGPLPPGVFEMPPHMVREMQSQMSPGMRSQCPQQ